ncbi:DUF3566 domain-containing protein [Streptomyces sp. URMC 123]|uniref:DUF3566 domain-containing protein n=1 Tax=Streptomyces sp. URMC 123 TaxID=3423403 RepID=UPI003F1A4BE9
MSGATGAGVGGPGTEEDTTSGSSTTVKDGARGSAGGGAGAVGPAGAGDAVGTVDPVGAAGAADTGKTAAGKPVAGKTAAGKAAAAARNTPKSTPKGSRPGRQARQGGSVTETRQPEPEQQSAQPYHPPQAYPSQAARKPRTGGPGGQGGTAGTGAARTVPRTRKARLRVAKADPWSVMKVSFLLSIALGICTIVAVSVLWMVLDAMGVFSAVGGTISEATGSNEGNGFDLQSFLSLPRVLMFTSVIAVIDVVLATALATLGAFVYNLSAGFVGGIELTLAEDE